MNPNYHNQNNSNGPNNYFRNQNQNQNQNNINLNLNLNPNAFNPASSPFQNFMNTPGLTGSGTMATGQGQGSLLTGQGPGPGPLPLPGPGPGPGLGIGSAPPNVSNNNYPFQSFSNSNPNHSHTHGHSHTHSHSLNPSLPMTLGGNQNLQGSLNLNGGGGGGTNATQNNNFFNNTNKSFVNQNYNNGNNYNYNNNNLNYNDSSNYNNMNPYFNPNNMNNMNQNISNPINNNNNFKNNNINNSNNNNNRNMDNSYFNNSNNNMNNSNYNNNSFPGGSQQSQGYLNNYNSSNNYNAQHSFVNNDYNRSNNNFNNVNNIPNNSINNNVLETNYNNVPNNNNNNINSLSKRRRQSNPGNNQNPNPNLNVTALNNSNISAPSNPPSHSVSPSPSSSSPLPFSSSSTSPPVNNPSASARSSTSAKAKIENNNSNHPRKSYAEADRQRRARLSQATDEMRSLLGVKGGDASSVIRAGLDRLKNLLVQNKISLSNSVEVLVNGDSNPLDGEGFTQFSNVKTFLSADQSNKNSNNGKQSNKNDQNDSDSGDSNDNSYSNSSNKLTVSSKQFTMNNLIQADISLIHTNADGVILDVNNVFEKITGFHRTSLIGNKLTDSPLHGASFLIPSQFYIQSTLNKSVLSSPANCPVPNINPRNRGILPLSLEELFIHDQFSLTLLQLANSRELQASQDQKNEKTFNKYNFPSNSVSLDSLNPQLISLILNHVNISPPNDASKSVKPKVKLDSLTDPNEKGFVWNPNPVTSVVSAEKSFHAIRNTYEEPSNDTNNNSESVIPFSSSSNSAPITSAPPLSYSFASTFPLNDESLVVFGPRLCCQYDSKDEAIAHITVCAQMLSSLKLTCLKTGHPMSMLSRFHTAYGPDVELIHHFTSLSTDSDTNSLGGVLWWSLPDSRRLVTMTMDNSTNGGKSGVIEQAAMGCPGVDPRVHSTLDLLLRDWNSKLSLAKSGTPSPETLHVLNSIWGEENTSSSVHNTNNWDYPSHSTVPVPLANLNMPNMINPLLDYGLRPGPGGPGMGSGPVILPGPGPGPGVGVGPGGSGMGSSHGLNGYHNVSGSVQDEMFMRGINPNANINNPNFINSGNFNQILPNQSNIGMGGMVYPPSSLNGPIPGPSPGPGP